jgi:hypothetical protein
MYGLQAPSHEAVGPSAQGNQGVVGSLGGQDKEAPTLPVPLSPNPPSVAEVPGSVGLQHKIRLEVP